MTTTVKAWDQNKTQQEFNLFFFRHNNKKKSERERSG